MPIFIERRDLGIVRRKLRSLIAIGAGVRRICTVVGLWAFCHVLAPQIFVHVPIDPEYMPGLPFDVSNFPSFPVNRAGMERLK